MIIVFEGLDGSGKDTQIELYSKYLDSKNIEYEIINSLEDNEISKIIRKKLKSTNVNIKQLAGLFIAQTYEIIPTIMKAIKQKKHVLINRWIYSTIAYNGDNDITKEAISSLSPNLDIDKIIYLDIDPMVSINRINNRNEAKEIFETEVYIKKIYDSYSYILKKFKNNINIINSEQDINSVHKDIVKTIGL